MSSYDGDGLDDVRALMPAGVTGAVIGPSGAGKSTLVNALVGHAAARDDRGARGPPRRAHDERPAPRAAARRRSRARHPGHARARAVGRRGRARPHVRRRRVGHPAVPLLRLRARRRARLRHRRRGRRRRARRGPGRELAQAAARAGLPRAQAGRARAAGGTPTLGPHQPGRRAPAPARDKSARSARSGTDAASEVRPWAGMADAPDPTARVAGLFDALSATYDAVGVDFFAPIADGLLAAMPPRPGERWLDVGCGRGAVALPAARAVGTTGHVTGIDISSGMVEQARRLAAEQGISNVDVAVGDARDPQVDGPFDAVASSLVLFFLPDPAAALRLVAAPARCPADASASRRSGRSTSAGSTSTTCSRRTCRRSCATRARPARRGRSGPTPAWRRSSRDAGYADVAHRDARPPGALRRRGAVVRLLLVGRAARDVARRPGGAARRRPRGGRAPDRVVRRTPTGRSPSRRTSATPSPRARPDARDGSALAVGSGQVGVGRRDPERRRPTGR